MSCCHALKEYVEDVISARQDATLAKFTLVAMSEFQPVLYDLWLKNLHRVCEAERALADFCIEQAIREREYIL